MHHLSICYGVKQRVEHLGERKNSRIELGIGDLPRKMLQDGYTIPEHR